MTVFWMLALMLIAGVLMVLLPPLRTPRRTAAPDAASASLAVYRDQWREVERDLATDRLSKKQVASALDEIRCRVIEEGRPTAAADDTPASRTLLAGLALFVVAATVGLYLTLGQPEALRLASADRAAPPEPAAAAASGTEGRHATDAAQIQAMVARLAEKLKAQPDDLEGWVMLGRSYTALGRYTDGAAAMRRAVDKSPGNADLLADYADILAMSQGRRLAGEPARIIQAALDADPRHVKALALAGSVAFEAKDYANAQGYWARLTAVLPPDSDMARSVQGSIDEARRLDGGGDAAEAATVAPAAAPGRSLKGEVVLAPELAARVPSGDTLFIFARAVKGPRMPLAIVRQPVGAWPTAFELNDSQAMAPTMKLSGFKEVVVGVRVSRSGNATPQAGDLIGQSAPVAPGAEGLRIVIDAVQP